MRKAISRALLGLSGISATLLFIATVLSAYNSFARVVLNTGVTWIEELACYVAGFIMFIMLPVLEYNDQQLSIAFLDEKLKKYPLGRKIIFWIRGIVTIVLYAILVRAGVGVFQRNFDIGAKSPILEFSYGTLYLILWICLVLVIVAWLFHFFLKDDWDKEVDISELS